MEELDETKVHNSEICENCSCRLNDVIPNQAERAWVFALPKLRLFVKEHQVTVKICPCYGTMNDEVNFPFKDITERIIACAIEICSDLGPCLLESV